MFGVKDTCGALLVTETEPLIQLVREQGRSPGESVKCQVNIDRECGVDEDSISDCRAAGDQGVKQEVACN